jgi:hypothetical protein
MLTDEQVKAWRTDGYVAVEGFLSAEEATAAREDARALFPTREEYARLRAEAGDSGSTIGFGGVSVRTRDGLAFASLPFPGDSLSTVAFHPRVVAAAEQLLGTADLRLTQSLARATYCGPDTHFGPEKIDQLLHRDYDDNMLVTPPRDAPAFDQLAVLIYLTDVGIGEAPTYIVSKRHSDDRPVLPNRKTTEDDPELYSHEVPNLGHAGTAMFYTLRTWHRGSAGMNPEGLRLVHHAVYRKTGHDWINFTAWPGVFATTDGQRVIERLTPRQRELLGIPGPGDPFWTEETVADFIARYPAADADPYRV